MGKERLLAFTDGVIAIIITITVLELHPPHEASWKALVGALPTFLGYALSFTYVAIYWNNHHHLFQLVDKVDGTILWANLHLLFWLSLIPFATGWLGEHPGASPPAMVYGVSLLMPALAWLLLQRAIIRRQGDGSPVAAMLGADWKGKVSSLLYVLGIALALIDARLGEALFVLVAGLWFVPDRRVERALRPS